LAGAAIKDLQAKAAAPAKGGKKKH
jgi:hypothetical protein